MPTYEYRCKDCSHEFDATQSFTDDPLTECPSCGGTLKKKFGSVGISFKGSGFYKTDTRGSAASAPGDKAASTTPSSGDKAASTTPSSGDGSSAGSDSSTSATKGTPSSGSSSSTSSTAATPA